MSQEWSYMDEMLSAIPAPIAIIHEMRQFATAVYEEFTSGSAPPWFTKMPREVRSFVVQDFLPVYVQVQMTLDIAALAKPGSTATPMPGPTAAPSPSGLTRVADKMSSREKAVVAGTVVPVIVIGIAIVFAIWFIRRRKAMQRSRPTSTAHAFDVERATKRRSETTFTTSAQPLSYHAPVTPSSPLATMMSPASDPSGSIRRTLSESDLRGAQKEMAEMGLSKSQDVPLELEASESPKLERCSSASPISPPE